MYRSRMAIFKLALADYSDLGQRQGIDEDKGIQGPKEPSGRRGQGPGATQQVQRFPTLFPGKDR